VKDEALDKVIREYTREAGVRNLDRYIATLMRKTARRIAGDSGDALIDIDAEFVDESLGAPPHLPETAERIIMPGVVVGLAATNHGGDILFIEATVIPGGEGVRLRLTGQLGDVMQESAEAALSWVRSNAEKLEIDQKLLEACEVHLHVPAGAVPKDGPSAGVTIVTAIVSALGGSKANGALAMTGEISLRGKVLPVGGIKDKILAASRAGVEIVILPRRNEKDLVEVPDEVRDQLDLRLVDSIEGVLEEALEHPATP
jgi:ATP-dependent Lon protease